MRVRIFRVLFVSVFAVMLGLGIVAPLMPLFAESLGATGLWLGIIFSGFSLTRALFTPLVGKISDRVGRKLFITLGLFFYSLFSFSYTLAGDVYTLTGVRLLHGLASAMVIPIAMAYVGETTEKGREGEVMGTFGISLFLGMGSGPVIGGFLNDAFGMDANFYALAGLTGAGFLLTLFLLPEVEVENKEDSRGRATIRAIMRNRLMRGLVLFRITSAMRRGGVLAFLPILASRLAITPSEVGILLTTIIYITALLQRSFGKLADRHDKVILVVAGSLIGAAGLFSLPFARSFREFLAIGAVMGIGGGLSVPPATALTVKVGVDMGMGASMGLFNSAMSAGMVVAPLLSGIVMDVYGVDTIFYVNAVIVALGTAGFFLLARGEGAGPVENPHAPSEPMNLRR